MAYDWDGHRSRRSQRIKLTAAIALGLSLPLMLLLLPYID